MKRYLSLSALSFAAVVALAGCGSQTGPASDAPNPTQATGTAAQPGTEASAEHNEADVMFAQGMIPHHRQAVEMSDIILGTDGVSAEVIDLATRIKEAQAPEMETMTGWLEAWGEPVETDAMEGHDMDSMDGDMAGMMSEEQMGNLDAAQGDEAARMFLESMIGHHDGAVSMAQEEIDSGENPEAIALAEVIVETQQAEIQEMEELLAKL